MSRIRAQIFSLGGGILLSLLGVLLIILWIGIYLPTRNIWLEGALIAFTGAMLLYTIDGASESLAWREDTLIFDGWLTRRRKLSLHGVARILLVHEGLNPEWGIETLTFEHGDGSYERLPLGPLWRRTDLETLLVHLRGWLQKQKSTETEEVV